MPVTARTSAASLLCGIGVVPQRFAPLSPLGDRGVFIFKKVVESMAELKDIDIELAKLLLEQVEKEGARDLNWTYEDVASELSKRLGRSINAHFGLRVPLGVVMELCFDLDLPLITAIVRRKGTKEGVGDGFYALACDLKPQYKELEPLKAWKQELMQIRQCDDWSALRDYLNRL